MKRLLVTLFGIIFLLLTIWSFSSKPSDALKVNVPTSRAAASCHYSSKNSTTDFHAILASNAIQCPPIASSTLSGNPSFGNSFLPYSVLIKYNHSLHKAQWNIRCDVDFTSNDLVQAHYYVFALRRILI